MQVEVVASNVAKGRAFQEENKVAAPADGLARTSSRPAVTVSGNDTTTTFTVSDLYWFVKQFDGNLINAIQGFNTLGSKMDALGYQLQSCCCDIKTQMLQNRLDDANAAFVAAQGVISNANQSQYLLSQLGSYTPGA